MAVMNHRASSSATVNTSYTTSSFDPDATLPPTCNHLNASQRSRLVRSSRKLGKVLGITPFVLESLPSFAPTTTTLSDAALKRFSAPPTPTSSHGEFNPSPVRGSGPGAALSRKESHTSTMTDDSSSSRPFLAESETGSIMNYRKSSSDGLAPLPVFPSSDAGRQKPKRTHQPVLRLPPPNTGNTGLSSPLRESFPGPFQLNSPETGPVTTPLPGSPTSPVSPTSSGMPPTPPSDLIENDNGTYGDDEYTYPAFGLTTDAEETQSKLRKRRMEKLMRHLGERVPSELVFGSSPRARESTSVSESPMSPPPQDNSGRMGNAQARILRRVSVVTASAHRKRERAYVDGPDMPGSGYMSGPETVQGSIHAVLLRKRSDARIGHGARRDKDLRHLVEDEWTPEAYEDVVKRLRRLK